MTDEERLKKWLEEHDGEDYCSYCIYDSDCSHGVVCYGGPTIEPPCYGADPEQYLDTEAILEDMEAEEESAANATESYREHIANRFLKVV